MHLYIFIGHFLYGFSHLLDSTWHIKYCRPNLILIITICSLWLILIPIIIGWHCFLFAFAYIINRLFITTFCNAIIFDQITLCKTWQFDLHFVITPMIWWYISILTSRKFLLYIKMRPIIILPGFIYNLYIFWLRLPIIKYMDHCAIFSIFFMNIVWFITSNISITIMFCALKSMRAYCIVHYQSAIYIFLYICSSFSSISGFSWLFIE